MSLARGFGGAFQSLTSLLPHHTQGMLQIGDALKFQRIWLSILANYPESGHFVLACAGQMPAGETVAKRDHLQVGAGTAGALAAMHVR